MHRMIPAIVVVASVAGLGACGMPSMAASPEREAEARVLLEDLVAGRDDVLAGKMAPQVDPAVLRAQLPFMKSMVPDGPVPKGAMAGWRANAGTGGMTYELNQTYEYPDRTLAVSTVFLKQGEVWKVLGFHISPTMKPGASAPQAGPEPEAAKAVETSPHSG
ncbi:MAG: hypothetical protein EON90_06430 [Brevundimonas sp.]|nr:MAG: hypothetical protein EON90_06430 [Brevundimonas sp.]